MIMAVFPKIKNVNTGLNAVIVVQKQSKCKWLFWLFGKSPEKICSRVQF